MTVRAFWLNFVLVLNIYDIYATETLKIGKKNVLFVLVDDLRPALGCFGDHKAITPNIDRMARQSFIFHRAYAQQALCAPSRNSLLTSRRPDTLRLYDFYSYWRSVAGNYTTLPQYFKSNGYRTYSIGKVFHPGKSSNFNDDFPYSWSTETYHPSTESFMNDALCLDAKTKLMQKNVFCPVNVKYQPEKTLPDIQSVEQAKRFLSNQSDTAEPFFLAIGFHKPHIPFRFPLKYLKFHHVDKFHVSDDDFLPYGLPTVAFSPFNDIRKRDDIKVLNVSYPFGSIPPDYAARLRQGYYASVTYVDQLIGDLFDHVDFSKTIVVLASDHGWSLGEHAEWAKYSNFDTAVRVPLIIYSPDIKLTRTKYIRRITELVDVFPTLVDLAGLPKIDKCERNRSKELCTEGKSMFGSLTNDPEDDGDLDVSWAISQYPRPGTYPTIKPDSDRPRLNKIKVMGYSIKTNRYRYTDWIIFHARTLKKDWRKSYGEELYDHSIDPQETMNLAGRTELATIKLNLKKLLKQTVIQ